jgi:hypothetical protein
VLGVAAAALVLLASGCVLQGTWTETAFEPVGTTPVGVDDVSCPAVDSCLAVGAYGPFGSGILTVQEWDGATWTAVDDLPASPPEGWAQYGLVSCWAIDACMVQFEQYELADTNTRSFLWDGTSFTEVPQVDVEGVDELDCWAADGCTAWYGGDEQAYRWDGSSWTTLPVIGRATVGGVACLDDDTCIASESAAPPATVLHVVDGVLTEEPSPFYLAGITCIAVDACHARSEDGSRLAEWDGEAWTERTLVQPEGQTLRISSIDCSSPTECVAVGVRIPTGGAPEAVALGWWGDGSWARIAVPDTWSDSVFQPIRTIDCTPGATACTALAHTGTAESSVVASFYDWS